MHWFGDTPRPIQAARRRATAARKRPSARCWPPAWRPCARTSYADLTVRTVAARAKVAPATAYTYFSSKNHLIAEVYLDLVRQVPYFTDVNDPMPTRVDKSLRHLALVVADEPEVGAACTTALLGGGADPAVRRRARPDRRGDPPPHHVGHRAGRRRPAPCPRSK